MKILILIILITINYSYCNIVQFNNSLISECTNEELPCDLLLSNYWINNTIPSNGDDIIIDLTVSQNHNYYLIINNLNNIQLNSFSLNGRFLISPPSFSSSPSSSSSSSSSPSSSSSSSSYSSSSSSFDDNESNSNPVNINLIINNSNLNINNNFEIINSNINITNSNLNLNLLNSTRSTLNLLSTTNINNKININKYSYIILLNQSNLKVKNESNIFNSSIINSDDSNSSIELNGVSNITGGIIYSIGTIKINTSSGLTSRIFNSNKFNIQDQYFMNQVEISGNLLFEGIYTNITFNNVIFNQGATIKMASYSSLYLLGTLNGSKVLNDGLIWFESSVLKLTSGWTLNGLSGNGRNKNLYWYFYVLDNASPTLIKNCSTRNFNVFSKSNLTLDNSLLSYCQLNDKATLYALGSSSIKELVASDVYIPKDNTLTIRYNGELSSNCTVGGTLITNPNSFFSAKYINVSPCGQLDLGSNIDAKINTDNLTIDAPILFYNELDILENGNLTISNQQGIQIQNNFTMSKNSKLSILNFNLFNQDSSSSGSLMPYLVDQEDNINNNNNNKFSAFAAFGDPIIKVSGAIQLDSIKLSIIFSQPTSLYRNISIVLFKCSFSSSFDSSASNQITFDNFDQSNIQLFNVNNLKDIQPKLIVLSTDKTIRLEFSEINSNSDYKIAFMVSVIILGTIILILLVILIKKKRDKKKSINTEYSSLLV